MKKIYSHIFTKDELYLVENAIDLLKTNDKVNCELAKNGLRAYNLMGRFRRCLNEYYAEMSFQFFALSRFEYPFKDRVEFRYGLPDSLVLPYFPNKLVLIADTVSAGQTIRVVNSNDIGYPLTIITNTDQWVDIPLSLSKMNFYFDSSIRVDDPLLNLRNHINLKEMWVDYTCSPFKKIVLPSQLETLTISEASLRISYNDYAERFIKSMSEWLEESLPYLHKLKLVSIDIGGGYHEKFRQLFQQYGFVYVGRLYHRIDGISQEDL